MNIEAVSPVESNLIVALSIPETEQQTPLLFSHDFLVQEHIADIRLAAAKMSGLQRRDFMAEMSIKYCTSNARLTERVFGWARETVETGLGEKRTGIVCIGLQSSRCGNIPWEEKHPEIAEFLCKIAENQSQQDPTFQSTIAFTRLTAQSALDVLKEAGFSDDDLPSLSSMSEILNRLGYRLRKVVKAKPLKKIKETDAIFENIKKKDQEIKESDEHVVRLSGDCKATVKIGEFSRGGLSRGNNKASDHDFATMGSYTPCGLANEDTGELYINMGSSCKTSDFIIDTLCGLWSTLTLTEQQNVDKIQLKMDNGPESSGIRTQFLKRIVEFADAIEKPIQLLYFPPYHSKYNPIERCWGILEMHWNGTLLSSVDVMVNWAKSMLWKGIHPIVEVSTVIYEKGISLSKKVMKEIEKRLIRNPKLPKWDILIEPMIAS
jgi:hypothetical protein